VDIPQRHQMIFLVAEFRPNPCRILQWVFINGRLCRGLHMASKRTEMAIEKIVAACDGNMRGALEALLLVNEHLEAEIHQLYAAVSFVGRDECCDTMH
jgi:hypothetical protein